MTFNKHARTAAVVLGAMLALGALASPASARWFGNGPWPGDDRPWDNHYYGHHSQPPPAVCGPRRKSTARSATACGGTPITLPAFCA